MCIIPIAEVCVDDLGVIAVGLDGRIDSGVVVLATIISWFSATVTS